jgi:hypothetical protein
MGAICSGSASNPSNLEAPRDNIARISLPKTDYTKTIDLLDNISPESKRNVSAGGDAVHKNVEQFEL